MVIVYNKEKKDIAKVIYFVSFIFYLYFGFFTNLELLNFLWMLAFSLLSILSGVIWFKQSSARDIITEVNK